MSVFTPMDKLRITIAGMRADGKTYQFIGDKLLVNKGIIHKIHNSDYEPKDFEIRWILGLEDLRVDFVRQMRNKEGMFVTDE